MASETLFAIDLPQQIAITATTIKHLTYFYFGFGLSLGTSTLIRTREHHNRLDILDYVVFALLLVGWPVAFIISATEPDMDWDEWYYLHAKEDDYL